MFEWYKSAEICFVYLYDVTGLSPQNDPIESSSPPTTRELLIAGMKHSEWFFRGWTLQELLAPRHVLFFSRAWAPIGSVCAIPPSVYAFGEFDESATTLLAEDISRVTRIPVQALTGQMSLEEFSVAEKMNWLSRRSTTRVEDMAYCVIGLFGINIFLLYGEGRKVFQRLQEEIVRRSGDESIFAWPGSRKTGLRDSIFASDPADFLIDCPIYTKCYYRRLPYWNTNQGLELRLGAHSALTLVQEQRRMDTGAATHGYCTCAIELLLHGPLRSAGARVCDFAREASLWSLRPNRNRHSRGQLFFTRTSPAAGSRIDVSERLTISP